MCLGSILKLRGVLQIFLKRNIVELFVSNLNSSKDLVCTLMRFVHYSVCVPPRTGGQRAPKVIHTKLVSKYLEAITDISV